MNPSSRPHRFPYPAPLGHEPRRMTERAGAQHWQPVRMSSTRDGDGVPDENPRALPQADGTP